MRMVFVLSFPVDFRLSVERLLLPPTPRRATRGQSSSIAVQDRSAWERR